MLPIKLTMHYFGPYRDETVDFSQLTTTPVFLVSGNTGSGKTTIFDAMCYALFGQTTNNQDRDASAMRSDFAPDDQETSVTFIFRHKGKQYQITRKPAQNLMGQRGRFVAHGTKVSLIYPLDSQHPQEITKIKSADDYITHLLNMTRDQFKQIVLLPQGKFRQFLVSSSSEKEALLRDLFNTDLYQQWAQKLKERLTAERKQHQTMQTKLVTLQERVSEIDDQLAPDEWLAAADKLVTKHQKEVEKISREINLQQTKVNQLIEQKNQQEKLLTAYEERKQSNNKLHQLQNQKPEIEHLQQKVDHLSWYQQHQEDYLQYQHLKAAVNDSRQQVVREQGQQAKLQKRKDQLEVVTQQLADQAGKIAELQKQANTLSDQLPQYAQKTQLKAETAQQAKLVKESQQQVDQAQKRQTSITDQLRKDQSKLEQLGDLADRRLKLEADRHRLQDGQRKLTDYQTQQDKLTQLDHRQTSTKEALQQYRRDHQKAQRVYDDLKDAHARSEIANLVKDLKPGTPCPVCGSLDHPHPTSISAQQRVVSNEEVEKANQIVIQKQDQVVQTQSQLKEWQSQRNDLRIHLDQLLKELQQALNTTGSFEHVQKLMTTLADQVNDDSKKIDYDEKCRQEINTDQERLHHEQEQLQEQLTSSQKALQEAQLAHTQKQTALQTTTNNLSDSFADEQAAQQQLNKWQEQIDQFTHRQTVNQEQIRSLQQDLGTSQEIQHNAQAALDKNRHALDQQKEQLSTALTAYSTNLNWDFWQWAGKHLTDLDGLRQQVQAYQNNVAQVKSTIKQLNDQIGDQPQPSIDKTHDELAQAQQKASQLQQQRGQQVNQLASIQETVDAVDQLNQKQHQALSQITDIQTISDVMNGNTDNKLSLERYVLQSYLSDVLRVANQRLAKLTNGRYAFKLSDDQAKGNGTKWSGLEINVYDDNAGQERSARTLSGGESFVASLALALGLGEVIQERSGGIQVDALFIDEGFGSLDQEALNQALNSLQSIQGYQMIGIISHVTELENQIPTQLQVVSQNGVSHVRYRHEIATL